MPRRRLRARVPPMSSSAAGVVIAAHRHQRLAPALAFGALRRLRRASAAGKHGILPGAARNRLFIFYICTPFSHFCEAGLSTWPSVNRRKHRAIYYRHAKTSTRERGKSTAWWPAFWLRQNDISGGGGTAEGGGRKAGGADQF